MQTQTEATGGNGAETASAIPRPDAVQLEAIKSVAIGMGVSPASAVAAWQRAQSFDGARETDPNVTTLGDVSPMVQAAQTAIEVAVELGDCALACVGELKAKLLRLGVQAAFVSEALLEQLKADAVAAETEGVAEATDAPAGDTVASTTEGETNSVESETQPPVDETAPAGDETIADPELPA